MDVQPGELLPAVRRADASSTTQWVQCLGHAAFPEDAKDYTVLCHLSR